MSKYISISLSIAILSVFLYTLFTNALNLPSFDDYDATLSFIKSFYFDNLSLREKIQALFARHNEHRILFSKVVAATYFSLFREINFAHLVIFQNVFLFTFFGIILFLFKDESQLNPTVFLLITSFLFSFSIWQVSFYYWAGIQHFVVFLFSCSSLVLLNKANNKLWNAAFIFAALFAVLGVLSFGNGFLVLLLGIFLLFAQKKYSLLIAWTAFSSILLFVTFFVQQSGPGEAHGPFNLEWMMRLLFTFLGSFLYINPFSGQYFNVILCMLAGFAVLSYWLWLFFTGYAFKKPLLFALFSLPVLTGIIISISRFETRAAGGIAPRYMFFTATIPILLLLILLDRKTLKREILPYLAIPVSLIWCAMFYNNSYALKSNNQDIAATVEKWKTDNSTRLVYYQESESYSKILNWAINHRVVNFRSHRDTARAAIE